MDRRVLDIIHGDGAISVYDTVAEAILALGGDS